MRVLGIHLDERSVRGVVLAQDRQQTSLSGRAVARIESPAHHAAGLKAVLEELVGDTQGDLPAVAVAIPAGWGFWARLELPGIRPGTARFTNAVRYELERYVPVAIEDLVVVYLADGQHVLAGGIPKKRLEELQHLLEQAGIYPDLVIPDAVAAPLALDRMESDERQANACIRTDSHWLLVARRVGGPVALRALRAQPEDRHPKIAARNESLMVLAGQVRAFQAEIPRSDGLDVAGSDDECRRLVEHMNAAGGGEVRAVVRLHGLGADADAPPAEFLPAIGAALGLLGGRVPLSLPLESVGHPVHRRRLFRAVAIACAAAALLLAVAAWQWARLSAHHRARSERYATQIQNLWADVHGPNRPMPPAVRATLAAELRRLSALAGSGGVPRYHEGLDVFNELVTRLPKEVPVAVRSVRIDQNGVSLRGNARSHAEAGRIAKAIDASIWLQCRQPVTRANKDGTVNFTMRINYVEP